VTGPLARAEAILRVACGDRVRTNLSMAPLTTFRIGGPAAIYLEPESERDLAAVAEARSSTDLPVVVLGKGSNVLVSDRGFPGIVLRLGRAYRWTAREGLVLTAGASMPLPALAGVALHHGLTGLEFGVAIPATLGGVVMMNAGAHGRSISEVLTQIDIHELRDGEGTPGPVRSVAAAAAGFTYRGSSLPPDAVITGATLELEPGEEASIRALMDEAREWRRRTQPLAEPNCGSVFKNPPGAHAAGLIEDTGLKGARVGGVSVSSKHANFIVAEAGASAADVRALISRIQAAVEDRTGVRLETEVRIVGEFDDVIA
jgi:UDP-N-acetylmuramate dehydrogenase